MSQTTELEAMKKMMRIGILALVAVGVQACASDPREEALEDALAGVEREADAIETENDGLEDLIEAISGPGGMIDQDGEFANEARDYAQDAGAKLDEIEAGIASGTVDLKMLETELADLKTKLGKIQADLATGKKSISESQALRKEADQYQQQINYFEEAISKVVQRRAAHYTGPRSSRR